MRGRYYEELEVGDTYEHEPGRTISEFENTLITLLTCNLQPLHLNAEVASETEFGERLVHSGYTMSIVIGQHVQDVTLNTTVANLGMEEVTFPNPVFIGDTIYSKTEVLDKRLSESRKDSGIVTYQHVGYNQEGDVICRCKRTALMLREAAKNRSANS
ncbi:MaoC family dehydratase [Halobacteriales archaeon Cl-PHB]